MRYWKNGESRYVAHDVNTEKKTNFHLKNLEQNVLYNLRVFGYSRGGEGLSSSPTVQFIIGEDHTYLKVLVPTSQIRTLL